MDSNTIIHHYSATSRQELIDQVDSYFKALGYKQENGVPGNASYSKGNRVMRILLGAFVKYFKVDVSVSDNMDGIYKVGVKSGTSGMSGGLIGMNQVKNEMNRIGQDLQRL
ncbi:MAG: hypothetical protein JST26_00675 [Bacteroidetes bacterium]|nr:hypothetical protein [Bacteroidota bacterium]